MIEERVDLSLLLYSELISGVQVVLKDHVIRKVQARVIVVLRLQVGYNHCRHWKVLGHHLVGFSHIWLHFLILTMFFQTWSWLIACDRDELCIYHHVSKDIGVSPCLVLSQNHASHFCCFF